MEIAKRGDQKNKPCLGAGSRKQVKERKVWNTGKEEGITWIFAPVDVHLEPTPVSGKSDHYLMFCGHLQNVLVDLATVELPKFHGHHWLGLLSTAMTPTCPRLPIPLTVRIGMEAREEQHATQASLRGKPGVPCPGLLIQLLSGIINGEARD